MSRRIRCTFDASHYTAPPLRLLDLDSSWKALRELADVGDHPHEPAIAAEVVDGADHEFEAVGVEGAEALVEEEARYSFAAVDGEGRDLLRKRPSEGQ